MTTYQFEANWPPVVATGTPVAGTGVDTTKLGVQVQSDGTAQVTYSGHLLYTFVQDMAPGDSNGQGLGPNNWFVLDAAGNPIGAPGPTVSQAANAKIGQPLLVDADGIELSGQRQAADGELKRLGDEPQVAALVAQQSTIEVATTGAQRARLTGPFQRSAP